MEGSYLSAPVETRDRHQNSRFGHDKDTEAQGEVRVPYLCLRHLDVVEVVHADLEILGGSESAEFAKVVIEMGLVEIATR